MLRHRGTKIFISMILIGLVISGNFGFIVRGDDDANSNKVNNHIPTSLDQRVIESVIASDGGSYRITPSHFITTSNLPLLVREDAYGYEDGAIHLKKGDSFETEIHVPDEGQYTISFDYFI